MFSEYKEFFKQIFPDLAFGALEEEKKSYMGFLTFVEAQLVPSKLSKQQFCLLVSKMETESETNDKSFYNEIPFQEASGKGHFYIGKFPLVKKDEQGETDIEEIEPAVIVSCCTDDQFSVDFFEHQTASKDILKALAEKNNGQHFQISMIDHTVKFETEDMEQHLNTLFNTVCAMHQAITAGLNVYVHCNEGKGRSLMVSLFYFCVYEKFASIITANKHIKKHRVQVSTSEDRQETVRTWLLRAKEDSRFKAQRDQIESIIKRGDHSFQKKT